MATYWKYYDAGRDKEVVCVHSPMAGYDTLCGLDLNDERGIGLMGEPVDNATVTCPACIEIINAVLDLPLRTKLIARKHRPATTGEGD